MTNAPGGETVTVRLDASDTEVQDASAVAEQIPLAGTLAGRTRVTVLPTATRRVGVLRRWLGQRSVPVPRSVRCTALLMRGYVDIGADVDGAWGYAPGG